ncbi:PIN domain-containing protein [Conexibacter arvalis]|uniref:Ribonuclease VapC n=1 Tax=Conexibacter arvalis TaxID=912552 RepID=A0A840IIT2_9ACTN|nr:putative nucleic acid-binding protein [Conexibacter arvalis]
MRYVLDAWPVSALLNDEPAAGRVAALLRDPDIGMSSVNLGEVYYGMIRRHGQSVARELVHGIRQLVTVEDPDWELVRAASEIKAGGGLSYPDAFCVATAMRHGAPLYTGDPEIIRLGADIEVIDLRSTA